MKLFKLMASVCAVSAAFMFAACDDSSSASSNDEPSASNDCSVEDGVKVVSPKKGETDQVHLQMNGANAFGRIITEQMRAHTDPIVKKLGDYMAPMYQVEVKVSPEGAAEATSINAYYPKGMTVMLKTIPKSGKKFLGDREDCRRHD